MKKGTINNVRLGVFVMAGLLFLILLLYMIGKNRNLFGANFVLKARFENVHGLMPGNNVRFSGIEIGTVKSVNMLNDTLIEVEMMVKDRMSRYIHNNAVVAIGTDGLVGNKIINIIPLKDHAPLIQEGDVLRSRNAPDAEEMLSTLQQTNNDVSVIAADLKTTIQRINSSTGVWALLNDESIPADMRASIAHIRLMASTAERTVDDIHGVIAGVKNGNGSIGVLLKDTSLSKNLNEAVVKIAAVGSEADSLTTQIHAMVQNIQSDIEHGKGPANAVLKDTAMANHMNKSLINIEKGTESFNQNMEALKHSFLLKGYFKKQGKNQKEETAQK